jgi:general secretion pathway protein G
MIRRCHLTPLPTRARSRRAAGFTLIELLVAMAIIALLLSIVTPRYFGSISRTEEAVLRENLYLMRDAVDKFYADSGRYPESLQDLVDQRYLRMVPEDPITRSNSSWVTIPPADPALGTVFDVKSGAGGTARTGRSYAEY